MKGFKCKAASYINLKQRTMVEILPRLLVEFILLNFLLWQFGFRHGSSDKMGKLDPKEAVALVGIVNKLYDIDFLQVNNDDKLNCSYWNIFAKDLRIKCNDDCGHNNRYCHVKEFSFTGASLSGIISPQVDQLKQLEKLDLSLNQVSGFIPATLWNLSSLKELDLSSNQLTEGISENIKYLSNLAFLYLEENFLSGPIPQSLGSLDSLQVLSLEYNELSGQIPDQLGNITQLHAIYLNQNQLSGGLPRSLENLSNLVSFAAASNDLTGEFPDYSSLNRLQMFSISGNYMSGRFPAEVIKKWTQITFLSMLGNNFEGSLPAEIFNYSNLQYLTISDLANSNFQFPRSANLSIIRTLILRNCSITDKIPEYIGKMQNLEYLDLSFNKLTGGIPQSISNINLTHLSLAHNKLNETIPPWVGRVRRLDLSYNNFSEVSFRVEDNERDHLNLFACCHNSTDQLLMDPRKNVDVYCHGSNYRSLYIDCGGKGEPLHDKIYDADNSTSLYYISPKKTWAYSLSGDYLLPESNSSDFIQETTGIDVTEAGLYLNARIAPVSLSYYVFCLHKGNYNVTLHFAEIVFRRTTSYSKLKRRIFDVYIQGNRVLTNFDIRKEAEGTDTPLTRDFPIHVNNSDLLNISFYWPGKGSTDDDPPSLNGPLISAISITYVDHPPAFSKNSKIALISGVVSSVVVLLLLLAFMWKMGWLGKRELREIQIGHDEHVTLEELIDATQKFSDKMEIGRGHFGRVYKAELKGGQTVAVKRLSSHSKEKIEELLNEFYTLKSLRHENLVQLLDGYFGKGLHLLIYEYMPNKSIADALFDSNSRLKLNWETRFNICLGIARGLEHLHEHPRLKMVHRDIKAENILLDGALNVKISDFGFASLYNEEEQLTIIKVEAPNGYMAPEYAIQGFVTSKIDVYSFGVVILEIVCGKKNAGYKYNHESEYLLDMAYVAYKNGRLMDLVDKNLSGIYDAKQAITVLTLAVICTNISPTLRPKMTDVVSILIGEKTFGQINPAALDDHHLNVTMACGEISKADSSTCTEVASRASTSTKIIKGIDEEENRFAETDL